MRHVRRCDDRPALGSDFHPVAVPDRTHPDRNDTVDYGDMLVGRMAVRSTVYPGGAFLSRAHRLQATRVK